MSAHTGGDDASWPSLEPERQPGDEGSESSPGGLGSPAASNPWSVAPPPPPSQGPTPSPTPGADTQAGSQAGATPPAAAPSASAGAGAKDAARSARRQERRAAREPVLRYVPGQQQQNPRDSASGPSFGASTPPPFSAGDDERTQELPPGFVARPLPSSPARGNVARPVRAARSARSSRGQGRLYVVLSILIVLGVIGALLSPVWRGFLATSSVPVIGGCGAGSPCQAATAYLADYGSGNYEAMYGYVSSASRTQLSSPNILGSSYKDAHDYIVNRTQAILAEAQITTIQTTVGETTMKSDTSASVAVHVAMSSARLDPINQDLSIPMVKEGSGGGTWKVNWTPGLIFRQLDDPTDPNYTHLVRLNETVGTRGTIYDAAGDVLAKDDTVYDIDVDPSKITNESALDNALATDLNMSAAQVKAAYSAGAPVRTITAAYYAQLQSALGALPGVSAQQRSARVYPYGPDLFAVTGYVSGVTPDDLKNDTTHYYCEQDDPNSCGASDVAGHAGLEQWGEQYLRPTKGGTLVIVARNADGTPSSTPLTTLGARAATNGDDIHTTISLKDQQAAMGMLRTYQQYNGGAFAVDPATGNVLLMASYTPLGSSAYKECDPNDFSLNFQPAVAACTGTTGAQLNRALASAQPIGSMFKIVTLSAYLQSGGSPTKEWDCTGSYLVPGQQTPLVDNDPIKPKQATAPGAIGPSCDTTYWEIGVALNSADPTLMPTEARGFGYGAPVNVIGVPSGVESAGLVPDPAWLKQTQNANWAPIDAANLAIGQGAFLATPAQVALVAAGIANNGVRMQPTLIASVTGPDGSVVLSSTPRQLGTIPLSAQNLQIVQQAMLGPTSPGGTAYSSFQNFGMPVAGKTGTAETPQPRPQSWFMSYAPVPPKTPTIATGVLVEHSTYGEYCAVPMTMQILRAQLNLTGNPDPTLLHYCQTHGPFP